MFIIDDLYWFHEIVDELCYKEATRLEATNKYIGWMVNVNDGLIWSRYRIIVNEYNELSINGRLLKCKLRKRKAYLCDCLDWLHSIGKYSNVTTIEELFSLKELSLSYTKVSASNKRLQPSACKGMDISALSSLTGLQKLYLGSTNVRDISALSSLTGLQTLYLNFTKVRDISALSSLTGLQKLYLGSTNVRDISALSSLTGLQELYLSNTKVSASNQRLQPSVRKGMDISALLSLTGLHTLNLCGCTKVSDISALLSLTGLHTLNLGYTKVSDISALASLTGLQKLYLWNTKVNAADKQQLRDKGIHVFG